VGTLRSDGIDDALARLADIHAQVARGAHFRGYRAAPVAVTAGVAVAAAAVEPAALELLGRFDALARLVGGALTSPQLHAVHWTGVAVVAILITAADLLRRHGLLPRRATALALGQLAPALAVGLVLLFALWSHAELLPGLWTMVFGLGILASAPYLPRAVAGIALYYLVAGVAMTLTAEAGVAASPWLMGLTFGGGQLASAAVLRADPAQDEELEEHDSADVRGKQP
jgi:hypothetical protein